MANDSEPTVGTWYRNLDDDQLFEVVALDDDTVEIQFQDGTVEELELEAWYELTLEPVPQPEDLSGPFDELATDEYGDAGVPRRPPGSSPLDELEREE